MEDGSTAFLKLKATIHLLLPKTSLMSPCPTDTEMHGSNTHKGYKALHGARANRAVGVAAFFFPGWYSCRLSPEPRDKQIQDNRTCYFFGGWIFVAGKCRSTTAASRVEEWPGYFMFAQRSFTNLYREVSWFHFR